MHSDNSRASSPAREFLFWYIYRMRSVLLLVIILAGQICCANNNSTGEIRGIVFDQNTNEPVSYCLVRVMPGTMAAQTDSDGIFQIRSLTAGPYKVFCQDYRYGQDSIVDVTVEAGKITHVKLYLRHPAPPPLIITERPFNKKRFLLVAGTETVLSVGSLIALNQLWYKDYPRTKFHTFNDNREWLGMDKIGHMQTAYTTGQISFSLLTWCGVKHKKAVWIGGLTGFAYQSAIEIMDGHSEGWGFSTGDMLANASGSALFISQQLIWHEQRIQPKFGFRRSGYAPYRPELLGTSYVEQLIKDYNGQTYWLSFNIASFMNAQTKFPQWLNIAVGYGANGMTGGHFNPPMTNAQGNEITIQRYRQYYLSFDIDLRKIKTRSPVLRTLFNTFGFLKIPAPGIELSQNRVRPLLFAF